MMYKLRKFIVDSGYIDNRFADRMYGHLELRHIHNINDSSAISISIDIVVIL